MPATCTALTTPETYWSFCPSIGAAYVLAVCFALTTIAHLVQGIYYRKVYSWVVTMGALWQTIAYITRILSIQNPASFGLYATWFILILVAPLWTNAYAYMVMGRMVWNYTPRARVYGVTAWRFGLFFVVLDIIAFVIQVYGAATAEGQNVSTSQTLGGLHIYMGGVGIQQTFILIFLIFAISFHRILLRETRMHPQARSRALVLLYTLYIVILLITMRIIFRLCEYAQGLDSTIPNHEAYQYCLDTLPMLLAFIALNIVHPGRIMRGPECDIPSRKQRKVQGISSKGDLEREPVVEVTQLV